MKMSFVLSREWANRNRNRKFIDGHYCFALPPDLPRTLREAMELARELEILYLWIGAIYVAQNDPEDIFTNINDMTNLYAHARVCFVAAAGEDVEAKLPSVS
jgi:Heterokaryon incompatibility protein (HET)